MNETDTAEPTVDLREPRVRRVDDGKREDDVAYSIRLDPDERLEVRYPFSSTARPTEGLVLVNTWSEVREVEVRLVPLDTERRGVRVVFASEDVQTTADVAEVFPKATSWDTSGEALLYVYEDHDLVGTFARGVWRSVRFALAAELREAEANS